MNTLYMNMPIQNEKIPLPILDDCVHDDVNLLFINLAISSNKNSLNIATLFEKDDDSESYTKTGIYKEVVSSVGRTRLYLFDSHPSQVYLYPEVEVATI